MKSSFLPLLILSASAVRPLYSQESPPNVPPSVIRIFREEIKPGRTAPHEKTEAEYVRAFARAKFPVHYLAATAMSGPNQVWFIEEHDSFAAFEEAEKLFDKSPVKTELEAVDARDGEYRSADRTLIAAYRADLSYRPGEAMKILPKSRHLMVATYRVRIGHDAGFAEAAKMILAANEKSNSDQPSMIYQVVAGLPGGSYLVFAPMPSLKSLDAYPARSKA
jgi:hypothetical protein